jgi:hypothetical protein
MTADRPEADHVLVRQREEVRGRLPGGVHAARPCLTDERDAFGGAHVHDVQAAAGVGGEGQGARDGLKLGDRRPGVQPAARVAAPGGDGPLGSDGDDGGVLGVHRDERVERGRAAHSLQQRVVVSGPEVRHAGLAHEGLEADDPTRVQRGHVVEVAGHASCNALFPRPTSIPAANKSLVLTSVDDHGQGGVMGAAGLPGEGRAARGPAGVRKHQGHSGDRPALPRSPPVSA